MKKQYRILSLFVILLFLAISVNAGQEFWGSRTSTRYHLATCEWAKKIIPAKRIVFNSPEEAKKAGYNPCPACRPPLASPAVIDEKEKAIPVNIKKDIARPANIKNILFVTAANPDYPETSSFISAVKSKLDEDSKNKINYSYEYLNPAYYHSDNEHVEMIVSFLKQKYQSQRPDVVIAHLAPLINKYADTIFPEVPVIYSGSENDFSDPRTSPYFMSYQGVYDFKKALKVIPQLQPETKKVYVVLGDSEEERQALPKIAAATQEYKNQIEFVYLNTKPFAEVLKIAGTLDNKSAILYLHVLRDVEGKAFISGEALRLLHKEASAPIYGIGGQYIGNGSIGGYILNRGNQGKHAAGIAMQILNGGKITEIHPENVSFGEYIFDWRELQRWKINEKILPPGSRIEYRQYTAWDLYKWPIVALLLVIVITLMTALVLIIMKFQRKKALAEFAQPHSKPEKEAEEETPLPKPTVNNQLPAEEEIHPVTITESTEAAALSEQPDTLEPPHIPKPEVNNQLPAEKEIHPVMVMESTEAAALNEQPDTLEPPHIPKPDVNNQLPEEEIHLVMVTESTEAAALNEQPDTSFGIDSLTGLYDHRQMEEKIREEVDRFQKNAKTFSKVTGNDIFKNIKSFSLMIGNIDLFQKTNEKYGSEAADSLLTSLAADFPKFLRTRDLVAHWQKEEFLFLLPEINLDDAKIVAERIREKIERQSYAYGDIKLSATMTFGVSTIHINETANDLLQRVDNALFKGKNTGGNCVVCA